MGRLIKTSTAGKDRQLFQKGIVLAIQALSKQTSLDETTKDILAYITLLLIEINETIDLSVAAWEKRGYWVKADHYRMEWNWSGKLGEELKQALLLEDWVTAVNIIGQVTQRLSTVKISPKNRMGSPWKGSYHKLVRPN